MDAEDLDTSLSSLRETIGLWDLVQRMQTSSGIDESSPPPYSEEPSQTAPKMGAKTAPSCPRDLTQATDKQDALPNIPNGKWDLACSIGEQKAAFLQLDAAHTPKWTPYADADTHGDRVYQRDGFNIITQPPIIVIANQRRRWTCDENNAAGQLLVSKRNTVSLRQVGEHLFVFEPTMVVKNYSGPSPKPRDDPRGCLKIQLQSEKIWTITGTDIYQVEGAENDVVVRSPGFFRLWDIAKERFRWERERPGAALGEIYGFTKKYFIWKVGDWHLYQRKTGKLYGEFSIPIYEGLISFSEEDHFGPEASTGGLFLYKPCRKALWIFRIDDEIVHLRLWKSSEDIRGSLVLRGNLENLELELIGQKPAWTKYEETQRIYKAGFIKRLLD